jgi:hypothetical protein
MLLEATVASLEAEKASAVSAVLRAASQAASAAASKLSQAAMAKVAVQTKRQAAGVEAFFSLRIRVPFAILLR